MVAQHRHQVQYKAVHNQASGAVQRYTGCQVSRQRHEQRRGYVLLSMIEGAAEEALRAYVVGSNAIPGGCHQQVGGHVGIQLASY
jgi:hypothetical protein